VSTTPIVSASCLGTNSSGQVILGTICNNVLTGSLTTTAATSDVVTVTGATSSSHCSLGSTNATAATNFTTTYVSAKATNSITVTHVATAGLTYDLLCTVN
jgi:ABC-type iron transport system FetAB permease component